LNSGLFEFWRVWDSVYQHMTRLEYVDKKNDNIFRVVFCKYHGPDLKTREGFIIHNGDPIVKLHLYNWKLTQRLKGIKNENKLGLTTLRMVKGSLPTLAKYVQNHPKGKEAKALIGTTFLHRGVERLGFDVEEVPDNLIFKWKNTLLLILLFTIHPNGRARLKTRPEELYIKRVFMSKDMFYQLYGLESALKLMEESQ